MEECTSKNTSSWFVEVDGLANRRVRRRVSPKRKKSFTDALKNKYLSTVQDVQTQGYVIMFAGRPKSADTDADLAYLRNVVLNNCNISTAGLHDVTLTSLCPNVVDLDLADNLLESWEEVLPVMAQLNNLKFLNLTRNKIKNNKGFLQGWKKPFPGIENLVLNLTLIPLSDVLCLAKLLPGLKELHICTNGYNQLSDWDLSLLEHLECLRLNNNIIESWKEIWKLRHLPNLKCLILSGNPIVDVFFHDNDLDLEDCVCFCHQDEPQDNSKADSNDDSIDDFQSNLENDINTDYIDVDDPDDVAAGRSQADGCYGNRARFYGENDENDNEENDEVIEDWCHNVIHGVVHHLAEPDVTTDESTNMNEQSADGNLCLSSTPTENLIPQSQNERNNSFELSKSPSEVMDAKMGSYICLSQASSEDSPRGDNSDIVCMCLCGKESPGKPFQKLDNLCLSETNISNWNQLTALCSFPNLKSLRVKDVKLGSKLKTDERRKLFIASLPHVRILNGSEVSALEREKSEWHFLRYFMDKKTKPDIYHTLEKKHGKPMPLVDIDISHGLQKWATLTFIYQGEAVFTNKFRLREPVGKLRILVAQRLSLYASMKNIRIFHKQCGPGHREPDDGETPFDQLFLDSLPMSRFDIMDGDEIHVDVSDNFIDGCMKFVNIRHYLPRVTS